MDLTSSAGRILARRLGVEALAGALIGVGVWASGLVPPDATAPFVVTLLGLAALAGRARRRWTP